MDGECVVFKVVKRWVIVNCKVKSLEIIGEVLRKILKEVIYLICFFLIFFRLFEDIVILMGIFMVEEVL